MAVYKSTGTSGKRCPKGYTSVTGGGTPTDAKTGEITRSGDTFYKKNTHLENMVKSSTSSGACLS